jgi:prefoldin subunit 5
MSDLKLQTDRTRAEARNALARLIETEQQAAQQIHNARREFEQLRDTLRDLEKKARPSIAQTLKTLFNRSK